MGAQTVIWAKWGNLSLNGEKDPEASYIPSLKSRQEWENLREKNPHLLIASQHIKKGDPNLRGNLTIDGLKRLNRGLDDKDL